MSRRRTGISRRSCASGSIASGSASCTSCGAPGRWSVSRAGFGTLDELFDALTLSQTGKAKPMPILLFDERYWRRIVNFDAMVQEGVISLKDRDLVRYVESAEAPWRAICAHYDIDAALADGGS
jgi:hypothetical protein